MAGCVEILRATNCATRLIVNTEVKLRQADSFGEIATGGGEANRVAVIDEAAPVAKEVFDALEGIDANASLSAPDEPEGDSREDEP